MSDIVQLKNLGALVDVKQMSNPLAWTAGNSRDSAVWTGSSIDREGFTTGSMPRSADFDIYWCAQLGSGNTLSLYLDVQNSANNSTWSDYATEAATVVGTGPSGGGLVAGVYRMTVQTTADNPTPGPGVNLGSAERYVRLNVTPHLSAAGTDTAIIQAAGVFGGFDQLAAPTT
jgi:hypothetical protein